MKNLKTGDLVLLRANWNRNILARRRPERLNPLLEDKLAFICYIPDGAMALYMGSHSIFRFVFWNGMPTWVNSENVVLERIAP